MENFRDHPRVQQVFKTLSFLINSGAKVVVLSHLSQKVADKKAIVDRFTSEFPELRNHIKFIAYTARDSAPGKSNEKSDEARFFIKVGKELRKLEEGNVLFLDNVRVLRSEDSENYSLRQRVRRNFDYLVHDAFGVSHRSGQFSNDALFKHFPKERKVLGPCSAEEWHKLLEFTAGIEDKSLAIILGGDPTKFASKLNLLENIVDSGKVGLVYLGGIFGYALLKANGSDFGAGKISLDDHLCERLASLVQKYKKQIRFKSPNTYKGTIKRADGSTGLGTWRTTGKGIKKKLQLKPNCMALDQFPVKFEEILNRLPITHVAAFGPLGYYKKEAFKAGTLRSYRNLYSWAKSARDRRIIVGGGDSLAALLELPEFQTESSLIIRSSGGGAGIAALGAAINLGSGNTINIAAIKALQSDVT